MEVQERPSGLVVPKEKPQQPERRYGPLEISDSERREVAKNALSALWDAMELSHPSGILSPSSAPYETHWKL